MTGRRCGAVSLAIGPDCAFRESAFASGQQQQSATGCRPTASTRLERSDRSLMATMATDGSTAVTYTLCLAHRRGLRGGAVGLGHRCAAGRGNRRGAAQPAAAAPAGQRVAPAVLQRGARQRALDVLSPRRGLRRHGASGGGHTRRGLRRLLPRPLASQTPFRTSFRSAAQRNGCSIQFCRRLIQNPAAETSTAMLTAG